MLKSTLSLLFLLISATLSKPWNQNDFVLKRQNSSQSSWRKTRRNIIGNPAVPDGIDIQTIKIGRVLNYGNQRLVVVTDEEGDKKLYPCSFFQWTYVKGCGGRRLMRNTVKIPSF